MNDNTKIIELDNVGAVITTVRAGKGNITSLHRARHALSAFLLAIALLGAGIGGASTAHALALPYATAGHASCTSGNAWITGTLSATNPLYFYPDAASRSGEAVYYQVQLQFWAPQLNTWYNLNVSPGGDIIYYPLGARPFAVPYLRWNPIAASFNYLGPSVNIQWSIAPQITALDIPSSGYWRVQYNLYWPATGQQASVVSNYCYVVSWANS